VNNGDCISYLQMRNAIDVCNTSSLISSTTQEMSLNTFYETLDTKSTLSVHIICTLFSGFTFRMPFALLKATNLLRLRVHFVIRSHHRLLRNLFQNSHICRPCPNHLLTGSATNKDASKRFTGSYYCLESTY